MLYATRRFEFSAAHRYWRDDWSREQNERVFGKCTSPYGHGHNYTLDVTIKGTPDPITGMIMNMVELKAIVGEVLEAVRPQASERGYALLQGAHPDHREYRAGAVGADRAAAAGGRGAGAAAAVRDERPMGRVRWREEASFSRSYVFSAAHRLHAPALSDAENLALYGKCNNPNGHGHNYTLEVTAAGPIDDATGMVIDLVELDATVRGVLDTLDHKHLDREVPAFASKPRRPRISSSICGASWRRSWRDG